MSEHLTFRFKKPGLQTTVQDMGRFGHQASGIPLNGVMDKGATKAANWLVGNQPGHPILEITLMGPHIVATGSGQIALTGADLSPTITEYLLPCMKP